MSKDYRVICVLDSIDEADSTLDVSPNYLHIHILNSNLITSSIDNFVASLSAETKNSDIYQWGTPLEKDAKTRSAKVTAAEVKSRGQVGIGSAAMGDNEAKGDFVGGGEGFLVHDENHRITRGNKAFRGGNCH